jgi:hypothetical protein
MQLVDPMIDCLASPAAVDKAYYARQLPQNGDDNIVGNRLGHHEAEREPVLRNVSNPVTDGRSICAQPNRLAPDPDLAGIRRVHTEQ